MKKTYTAKKLSKDIERDVLPQFLRAYIEPIGDQYSEALPAGKTAEQIILNTTQKAIEEIGFPYHGYVFAFDTETRITKDQNLTIGCYAVHGIDDDAKLRYYKAGKLTRELLDTCQELGLFYNPNELTECELAIVRQYAKDKNYPLHTQDSFIKNIFYKWVYHNEALCIAHNLPFDLSRLVHDVGGARGFYKGGFTFKLCRCENHQGKKYQSCFRHPHIRLKHVSAVKNFIGFQTPKKVDKDGKIVSGEKKNTKFLDTRTLGKALLGASCPGSLYEMGKRFNAAIIKIQAEEHGLITPEYLDYNVNDVKALFSLYQRQIAVYKQHDLPVPPWKISSEASIGKAYLQKIGVPQFQKTQAVSGEIKAAFLSTYYGGRSEVKCRNTLVECIYADFKSQYPTVNALMNLQEIVLAEEIDFGRDIYEVKKFIDTISAADLQKRETWLKLRGICRIIPNADILPIRTFYDTSGVNTNIGLNYATSNFPCWYTIADIVVSRLLTGKTPEIIEVMTIQPKGRIATTPIKLFGRDEYTIDLNKNDLFTSVIDLRTEVRQKAKEYEKGHKEREYLENRQNGSKLLATSTSYGVTLEVNELESDQPRKARAYTDSVEIVKSTRLEQAGKYFNPLIGTMIAGGARLLLGIAEYLGKERGIRICMTDTDSSMFARPDGMERGVFIQHTKDICDYFRELSPYADGGELFELEDANFKGGDSKNGFEPLYFCGVSAKRYALCNINNMNTKKEKIVIRAFKEHGLVCETPKGYKSIYSCPSEFDSPSLRWKHDIWHRHILNVRNNENEFFDTYYPVHMQETITSWHTYNIYGKKLGLKPFNFFWLFPSLVMPEKIPASDHPNAKPITGFYSPIGINLDRTNIPLYRLDTNELADIESMAMDKIDYFVSTDYFRRPEHKSSNSHFNGWLERRHIYICEQLYVGKEFDEKLQTATKKKPIISKSKKAKVMQLSDELQCYKVSKTDFSLFDIDLDKLASITGISKYAWQGYAASDVPMNMEVRRRLFSGLRKTRINPTHEEANKIFTDGDIAGIKFIIEEVLPFTYKVEIARASRIHPETVTDILNGFVVTKKTGLEILEAIDGLNIDTTVNAQEKLSKAFDTFTPYRIAEAAKVGLKTVYRARKGEVSGKMMSKLLSTIDFLLDDYNKLSVDVN